MWNLYLSEREPESTTTDHRPMLKQREDSGNQMKITKSLRDPHSRVSTETFSLSELFKFKSLMILVDSKLHGRSSGYLLLPTSKDFAKIGHAPFYVAIC